MSSWISFFSTRFSMKSAAVFCVGAIMGIWCIQFATLQVDLLMRTNENGSGSLQYFVDTGLGFNETQSKSIRLSESPDFTHYSMSVRANDLRSIRIDPLVMPGGFELLGLQIDYLFLHRQWNGHDALTSLVLLHEVEVKSIGGAIFSGEATGNDPRLVITDLKYLQKWQLIVTIFCAMLGGAAAFFLLVIYRYFGGFKTVMANRHAPLIVIVITAAMLRLIYWSQNSLPSLPSQLWAKHPDEGTYFSIAQYIMTHGLRDYFFSEQSVMATPVNPLYIALMYTALNSINTIRFINLLLSVLSIVLVYKLGKKMFSKPVGLLAAGICAVHGQLIQYSATLLTEPLFLFFFIAGIYYLVATFETQKLRHYPYCGSVLASALFLTLAILTRSIVMLLPVFLLTVIGSLEAYRSWRVGKPSFLLLKCATLPLLLPILIVGIVATKNYVVFDHFMVATGSGAALWLGSRADTEGDDPPYRGRAYNTQEITHGESHLGIQGDKLLMGAAKKNIRENPISYAWLSIKKIGRLTVGSNLVWLYPHKNIVDWYRASAQNALATAGMVFQIILAASIVVYGIIGFVVVRGNESFRLIICTSACYLVIFSVPFLVIQRYGLPLVMLLAISASAVLYGAWNSAGSLRRATLIGVPFVSAIVFQVIL